MVTAYQPVTYSATALLGSRLYIYGGLTNLSSSASITSQFATVSLANDFDTDEIPWEYLPGSYRTAMGPGMPSHDQRRFIVTGNYDHLGHSAALIFDSTSRIWRQAPGLPGDASNVNDYGRTMPGATLDTHTGVLIQFGGANRTNITNEINLLDTNKATDMMIWTYSGYLDSVPPIYAPLMIYLSTPKLTLIMGGCDQLDSSGNPSHFVTFDTLYTLTSDSVVTMRLKTSRIMVQGTIPPPRLLPCIAVLPDGNVLMMGGGNPNEALADAWILNTQSWTWSERPIKDMPAEGVMGHSCQAASNKQILVIGGHNNNGFVQNPLSVIRTEDWSWKDHFDVPGFSKGVKIGLGVTVVVVIGAIVAGLVIRWKRSKMASQGNGDANISKTKPRTPRSRSGTGVSSFHTGTQRPKRNTRTHRRESEQSEHMQNHIPRHHPSQQGGDSADCHSGTGSIISQTLPGYTMHEDDARSITRSIDGSPSSTILGGASPSLPLYDHFWTSRAHERGPEPRQDQVLEMDNLFSQESERDPEPGLHHAATQPHVNTEHP
ncbi:hypothetical protein BGZ51_001097 [Haplosporangium sp. Z 767]|nr:hypothetical protein BGZ51_001097 [Haplosporangium sp. Z 767]